MAKSAKSKQLQDLRPAERDLAARTAMVDGNKLIFLPDGPERLDQLIALIDGARHSLRLH
jgi:hypothetical protein